MTQDELKKAIDKLHLQICGAFAIPPQYLGMRKTIVGWKPAFPELSTGRLRSQDGVDRRNNPIRYLSK